METSNADEKVIYHVYFTPPSPKGPLFVTHHGAGSSSLSFAVLASELRKFLPEAGVLSLDARGHGETTVHDLRPERKAPAGSRQTPVPDLRLETLSADMASIIRLTQARMGWTELPGLVLVGHSLGGAVVTDVARTGDLGDRVLGYAVLDVVEGDFFSTPSMK